VRSEADRPGLKETLSHLHRDDTLVVWKLDRLGRTTKGLIDLVETLKERGIGFKSLQDNIDTSTPMGQFFFVVCSAIAALERSMIRERSQAGLAAARARERKGGRPFALQGDNRVDAMKLIEAGRDTKYVMELVASFMERRRCSHCPRGKATAVYESDTIRKMRGILSQPVGRVCA
jgi:DNA invertase Pin-like site-specific DNA recombinase